MVARIHYRWDFIGLSTDNKPTPETSEKVVDGSTYYCSDNSKLYVWYKTQWYERKPLGGGGGGGSYTAGTGIDITDDTISVDTTTIQAKLTAGNNITITDDTISATDTTYSAFTGTDGTAAGTAGLVPAPTTSDTDKYLKSDGSWATVSGGGGTTYTAGDGIDITNAVISATNTGKARVLTTDDYNWPTNNPTSVALWMLESGMYIAPSDIQVKISTTTDRTTSLYIVNTYPATVTIIGIRSDYFEAFRVVKTTGAEAAYQPIGLVNDTLTSTSTTQALSANQGKVLKDLVDSLAIRGSGAPTTSTVGAVGTLYEDTTNGKLYQCTDTTGGSYTWAEVGAGGGGSAIKILSTSDYNYPTDNPTSVALWLLDEGFYEIPASGVTVNVSVTTTWSPGYGEIVEVTKTQAGTPKSVLYFFGNAGGYAYAVITISSGAEEVAYTRMLNMNDVTQSTGTSTTSVMSQNAVTSMMFADPATRNKLQLGKDAINMASSSGAAIGANAFVASGTNDALAVGYNAAARATNSVALGSYSNAAAQGEMSIGNSSRTDLYNNTGYRLLTNVYDGQSAHDAATLAQGNTLATAAPTTATAGVLGQLYTDTTNMHTYQCTAIDTTDPQNPSYTWTQRW